MMIISLMRGTNIDKHSRLYQSRGRVLEEQEDHDRGGDREGRGEVEGDGRQSQSPGGDYLSGPSQPDALMEAQPDLEKLLASLQDYLNRRHVSIVQLKNTYADDGQMEAYYRGEQSMIEEFMQHLDDVEAELKKRSGGN